MTQEAIPITEEVVVLRGDVNTHVRLITLNRPRQLNVISPKVVSLLAESLKQWEKDDNVELVIFKVGNGRAYSAGGDLKVFYDGRDSYDACREVVHRMYWLCYHNHTYKKTQVVLVHGISMGGGASLMVPLKFSVVTEKTIFSMPEASIGFHTDCSFSYILSHLPGSLVGLATHYVPSEKLPELEKCLIDLNSGEEHAVKSVIEEFSLDVKPDEDSILNNQATIDKCFSKESVEEIFESLESEANNEGNEWIPAVLKGLKRSAPTGLKITLRSVREGRVQTLLECLKKEFRLTINILRKLISGDLYEGIRALTIDKDNSPM
ncbi:hypothetical protein C5167_040320, partial [Papaver somniferum]